MEFYLKLYNRKGEIKNEIYIFSNLTYTSTLNGTGSMSFNIPIKYMRKNEIDIILSDYIELYKIENNDEQCIWYGAIANVTNTSIDETSVVALGYFSLLSNRIQKHLYDHAILNNNMEYLEETYTNVSHGELIMSLIGTQNYYDFTGVTPGVNADYSGIKTDRIIKWDDRLSMRR